MEVLWQLLKQADATRDEPFGDPQQSRRIDHDCRLTITLVSFVAP